MRPPKPNSVEPPWYGTRMPGGVGGVASRGVPLSRSSPESGHLDTATLDDAVSRFRWSAIEVSLVQSKHPWVDAHRRARCEGRGADLAAHDRGHLTWAESDRWPNGGNRRDNAAARGVANWRGSEPPEARRRSLRCGHSSGSPAFRTPSNTAGQFGICSIIDLTVNFGFRRRASAKEALASSILPASA